MVTEPSSSHLEFGQVRQGLTASHEVVLANQGAEPLTLTAVLAPGPEVGFALSDGLAEQEVTVPPLDQVRLPVSWTPLAGGNLGGELLLTPAGAEEPQAALVLSGFGLAPQVSLDRDAIKFRGRD